MITPARWIAVATLVLLSACAGRRGAIDVGEAADHWRLEGRLAVSDGRDSGTGSVTWEQDGEYFMIGLRAPVSGQSWRLSGDGSLCTLEGLKPYPLSGSSPEALLERELGWHLPVAPLRAWLRGRPAHASVPVQRDAAGQIIGFVEQGWSISFSQFREGRPVRITARNPPYQVRLAIKSWVEVP